MEKVKNEQGELNYVFYCVVLLSFLSSIKNMIVSGSYLIMSETLNVDGSILIGSTPTAYILSFATSLLMVIFLIQILFHNKIGIYGYAAVVFLYYTISLAFYDDRLSQLPFNIGSMLITYVFFFGSLMIKRDGLKSWYIFFPKNEDNKRTGINERLETGKDMIAERDENESIDYTNMNSPETTSPQNHNMPLNIDGYNSILVEANKEKEENKEKEALFICQTENQKEDTTSEIKEHNLSFKKHATISVLVCIVLAGAVTGIFWYHKTCQPEYQYALADSLFKHGKTDEAMEIFTRLANQDNYLKAKTKLGILYVNNDSVKPNYRLGVKYLKEAKNTDSLALFELLVVYFQGTPQVPDRKNAAKSKQLANEAIKKGWFVGKCYCVLAHLAIDENDYSLAYYNWYKATEYNEQDAYDNLGWLYFNGLGCPEDNEKARFFWQKSLDVNKDNPYALYYMGLIYKYGYGVDINLGQAYNYLTRSADLGYDDAKKEVADLKMHHTAVELLSL